MCECVCVCENSICVDNWARMNFNTRIHDSMITRLWQNLAHTFWSTALVNPQNISGSPLQIFKKVQTTTA